MDFDLLVVGELNVDIVVQVDEAGPEFAQKEKMVRDTVVTLGSSSGIFACGAARLGLRTAFVGIVGRDPFGGLLIEALRARGIDTSGVIVDPAVRTGSSTILAKPGGDRAILTFSGSIPLLRADQVDRRLFERARHLHVGAYYMLDALRPDLPALLREARQAGMTTSLDTNWDPTEKWNTGGVLDECDVFLPNETELLAITHQPNLRSGLDALSGKIGTIAVKRGAEGAVARRGQESAECSPLPVRVVDTVGAGDSFDAGFIYGYLHGWTLADTLQLGCTCGSLSTEGPGGTTAQPTLEEALRRGGLELRRAHATA